MYPDPDSKPRVQWWLRGTGFHQPVATSSLEGCGSAAARFLASVIYAVVSISTPPITPVEAPQSGIRGEVEARLCEETGATVSTLAAVATRFSGARPLFIECRKTRHSTRRGAAFGVTTSTIEIEMVDGTVVPSVKGFLLVHGLPESRSAIPTKSRNESRLTTRSSHRRRTAAEDVQEPNATKPTDDQYQRMLMALAARMTMIVSDNEACAIIINLAQRDSTPVSAGESAVLVL
jgi:hypothetical protein